MSERVDVSGSHPDAVIAACDSLETHLQGGSARLVLMGLFKRQQGEQATTIWDLHRITGLPLNEAFAALRVLEFDRLVYIGDGPSDPFSATITLQPDVFGRLAARK